MTVAAKTNRLIIFDTTLRDGEQSPGASMNLAEKLEVAHAQMLGQMEQQAVYNAINFNAVPYSYVLGPMNTTASYTILTSFLCPSDSNTPRNGVNNYSASLGVSSGHTGGGG